MDYLNNTVLGYGRRDVPGYNVSDYRTITPSAVHAYVTASPANIFDMYKVQDNDKWERIANELYNNPDLWDVLLMINTRNPITGLPYDMDVTNIFAVDRVQEYVNRRYGTILQPAVDASMNAVYHAELDAANTVNGTIRIIKPAHMSEFLQTAYDQGIF